MVVSENGEAAKEEYRRFKIRYHPESPNDFAMMHEVITRRLKAYVDGDEKFQKLPDLIMIDGGKGQLAAALKARDELGLAVPMVGLAKRHELIYVPIEPQGELLADIRELEASLNAPAPLPAGKEYSYERPAPKTYSYREVELPLNSPGLMMLRKLRDEAHRFALTYHRKLRDKKFGGSSLDEIPGVGPRRKRLLLRTFGSVEGIRRATVDEIASVPTMTKVLATKIKDFLAEA
jgi:excinuclease ABC subunit C